MYKKVTKIKEYFGRPPNCICTDVPLFIRLLEYAREEASKDADLHILAERLLELSEEEVLTMEHYEALMKP